MDKSRAEEIKRGMSQEDWDRLDYGHDNLLDTPEQVADYEKMLEKEKKRLGLDKDKSS